MDGKHITTLLAAATLAACGGPAAERDGATADQPAATGDAAAPAPPVFAPELEVRPEDMAATGAGVLVAEIRQGRGREAAPGTLVSVEYRAWLPDGTLFEQRPSPEGFGPSEFILGAGGPVPGLSDGVEGMRPGGVRRLIVPPDLGYGLVGRPAGVPAGATLVFEVRLLRVADPPPPPQD